MEPVETSAASPWATRTRGSAPMGTLPARRRLTGRSSLAARVSSDCTAKPSMEARANPGTSREETIFSARMRPWASGSGTVSTAVRGRWL